MKLDLFDFLLDLEEQKERLECTKDFIHTVTQKISSKKSAGKKYTEIKYLKNKTSFYSNPIETASRPIPESIYTKYCELFSVLHKQLSDLAGVKDPYISKYKSMYFDLIQNHINTFTTKSDRVVDIFRSLLESKDIFLVGFLVKDESSTQNPINLMHPVMLKRYIQCDIKDKDVKVFVYALDEIPKVYNTEFYNLYKDFLYLNLSLDEEIDSAPLEIYQVEDIAELENDLESEKFAYIHYTESTPTSIHGSTLTFDVISSMGKILEEEYITIPTYYYTPVELIHQGIFLPYYGGLLLKESGVSSFRLDVTEACNTSAFLSSNALSKSVCTGSETGRDLDTLELLRVSNSSNPLVAFPIPKHNTLMLKAAAEICLNMLKD